MRLRTIDSLASVIAKSDPQGAELSAAEQRAQETQKARDYYLVARIHQFRLDPDSAIDAYNRASLLDPKDFYVAKEFGLYLVQLDQPQRAELQLRRAYGLRPNDQQVNEALAQIGIVPGPGLKDESQLAKPAIPKGPLPEVNLAKLRIGGGGNSQKTTITPPSPPLTATDQDAPRD
jgi:tetratricopeptide (TPR) repeat protein